MVLAAYDPSELVAMEAIRAMFGAPFPKVANIKHLRCATPAHPAHSAHLNDMSGVTIAITQKAEEDGKWLGYSRGWTNLGEGVRLTADYSNLG